MSPFVRELFVREAKAADEDGRWITINGRAIFIREGQSVEDAVAKRDGGKGDIVKEALAKREKERLALEERLRKEPPAKRNEEGKPSKQPSKLPASGSGKSKDDPIVVSEKPPKHLQRGHEQETASTTSRGFAYNDRVSFLFKDPEGKWKPASGILHEMDKGEGATISTNHGWFRVPKESLRFPKGYRRAAEG